LLDQPLNPAVPHAANSAIISGKSTRALNFGDVSFFLGTFWAPEKRTVGKHSVFVLELLPVD